MNKQELIERLKDFKVPFGDESEYVKIDTVIKLASELDEQQKVTIPQFVADWIEYCKNTFLSLARALNVSEEDFYNYANQKDHLKLLYFLGSMVNQEKFAKAWLFGYEAEKEKRYLVKMKGVNDYGCYLNKGLLSKKYFWESKAEIGGCRTKHTRKQLEDDDFGWVFDCPGIEIEVLE